MHAHPFTQFEIDLHKFDKGKRIGRGAFSFVYSIQERETKKTYAAKVIECDSDDNKRKNIIDREIRIMMSINHPTMIKFIGYSLSDFDQENNPVLIMELAQNGSLSSILKNVYEGKIPEYYNNTMRQILIFGIARAMKYLHDRSIIHRDLKPRNILINEYYEPMITDFGLSKFVDIDHSQSQSIHEGTQFYKAPEIIKKEPYGRKADVYSFAIILFEIINGSVPYPEFDGDKYSDYHFNKKIIDENYRPRFKEGIKDSFKKLIEQCWSANPNDRPSFQEIMKKLSIRINNEYLLDNVDMEIYRKYVEKVTKIDDSVEEFIHKLDEAEEDNKRLYHDIDDYREQNRELNSKILDLEKKEHELNVQINDCKIQNQQLAKNMENMTCLICQYVMNDNSISSKITFNEFNEYPLHLQQLIISKSGTNQVFLNICDLLIHMMLFDELRDVNCFKISTKNNNDFLMHITDDIQIQFLCNATETFYEGNSFVFQDFINILLLFTDISMEIKYPSILFGPIYEDINKMIETYFQDKRIKIDALFSKDEKNNDSKDFIYYKINNLRIDKFSAILDRPYFNLEIENELIIPSTLANVCDEAFRGLKTKKVTFESPSSLTSISILCFDNSDLVEINLPASITLIGKASFLDCSYLKEIVIPSSVKEIGDNAFCRCKDLKKINIPSSITEIIGCVFEECESLQDVVFELPSSLKYIGCLAFSRCNSLISIAIPSSVTVIECIAFISCKLLREVIFEAPSSLTFIGKSAFGYCSSLLEINIPITVTEIGNGAFSGCKSLTKISIPHRIRGMMFHQMGLPKDINITRIKNE